MTILISLAGAGSRFAQAGYIDPKPLIPVAGLPMIVQAVRQLPRADRYIFLCRSEHLTNYPLRKTLEQYFPQCHIVPVDHLTEGQAVTCLLAKHLIQPNEPLLIGACDNGISYSLQQWQALTAKPTIDAAIFSFRNNITVQRNPQAYGWAKIAEQNRVQRVSVKVPISLDPIHDQAVVGTFWFRHGQDFINAATAMIAGNRRINNEFYVDECMNNAIEVGLKVVVFEVDKYICWGTPNDLQTYNYWRDYFNTN